MPVLVVAGGSALCYWIGSEFAGQGDLRPYVLVQLLPILLTPLLLVLFPGPALLNGKALALILLFYGAALLVAYGDHFILRGSMGLVSGHSIKHVLAAIALLPLIRRVSNGNTANGRAAREPDLKPKNYSLLCPPTTLLQSE